MGKFVLAICDVVIFEIRAGVVKLSKPVEYKNEKTPKVDPFDEYNDIRKLYVGMSRASVFVIYSKNDPSRLIKQYITS